MNQKHLPFILLAAITLCSVAVGCGSDDPEVPPVTPVIPDTDTIVNPVDTTTVDTDTIVIPVDSTVYIKWSGTTATVELDESLADQITYQVTGGDVVVTNTNETDEFQFDLSGATTNGSFTYNGTYKTTIQLRGLDLTSATGGAIDIQCGKRVKLVLTEGTVNKLADAPDGEQKAALNCQGHLEVSGSGELDIEGNARHALRSKEYLQLKSSTGKINIAKAASDGIHVGEYFLMNGGEVTISNVSSDGLQVETDATSEEELNGQFIMNGGIINVTLDAVDAKAIRLDADETNTAIVPHMQILGGNVTVAITSTALGSRGLDSDGNITIGSSSTEPTIDVTVAAGTYTDTSTSEEDRATGIKAELTLTIAGGTTTVAATGEKSRGVRATTLTATGGQLTVTNTGTKSQGIKLDNVFRPGQGGTVNGSFKY